MFRAINEQLYALDDLAGGHRPQILLVCECSRRECIDRISIAVERFEELHGDDATVIVSPGHPADGERRRGGDGFELVRLEDEPGTMTSPPF